VLSFFARLRPSPNPKLSKLIQQWFGFSPGNIALYERALTHKSSLGSDANHLQSNERLEYLGDAVLGAATADYLFRHYPDKTEGELSELRSRIVSRGSLNTLAKKIGFDKHIAVEEGVSMTKSSVAGNAFEALLGAIYLDKGFVRTQKVLAVIFAKHLNMEEVMTTEVNHKGRLLEWAQQDKHKVECNVRSEGLGNNIMHFATVIVDEKEMGKGQAASKRKAEQVAAEEACKMLNI
jgi:ribonuclease-3